MEIIDEHGELCARCSDDPQDFIHIPPVEAIRLLTLKYIEQCGVSLGMRTLYYNAAEAWQEILAEALELLAFNIRLSKYYKRQKDQDSQQPITRVKKK